MRKKGKKIVARLTYREVIRAAFAPVAPLTEEERDGLSAFVSMLRENLYRPSPFARMAENIKARRIAADLVPHFDSSWRPLQARRLWRNQ